MRPFRSLRLAPIVFALALAVGLAAFPVRLSALPLAGKAGFFADLYPVFGGTNDPAIGSGRGTMTAEEFRDFTARPAILTLGFSLEQGPFFACMGMELQQEAAAYLGLQHGNNLPLNGSGDGLQFSNNYPLVGYAEAGGAGWDLSAGRRKLSFGPASHGLAIGADNPYYDGLVARVEAPVGAAALEYAYVLVSARRSGDRLKNLVLNALSLRAEGFQVGIAELNVVSGPSPDFLDIGPFVVYHHLFQSDSNVMLELNFSWTPLTGFSLFGEAVMDDFRLSQEGKDSNPTAMGFMGGLEWAPGLARRSVPRPSFYGADHVLPIAAGPLATQGTRIRAELYWTSTYLWGRGGGSDNTFRERYFIHSDAWTIVEPLLAAPLLPDSILARLVARTTRSGPLEGELALEYRILGENAVSGPGAMAYAPPYNEDWLGPSGSTTEKLGLKVGGLYAFDERTVVSAAARLTWTEGGGLDYDFSAGAGLRLGSGGRRLP